MRRLLILPLVLSINTSFSETTCVEDTPQSGDLTCTTTITTITNVPGVTTGNLLSQDFLDGSWSDNGTGQLNTMHGSGTVAGVNGGSVESTISLNDTLTKDEINSGFSSTLGADIWFWNGYTQSVTMRQTLVDDNGNSTTQSRTITSTNGFQNFTDTIIVGENSQQDYAITSRFDFSVPGTSGHTGADIRYPTLNVTTNDYTTSSTSSSESITYCFDRTPNTCPVDDSTLTTISSIGTTDDGKTYDEMINTSVTNSVEVKYEEPTVDMDKIVDVETSIIEVDADGNIKETDMEKFVEEQFTVMLTENNLVEEFDNALKEEGITKEEFFEEVATEMVEEAFDEQLETSESMEEEVVQTEEPIESENNDSMVDNEDKNETIKEEENSAETNTIDQAEETNNEGNSEESTETVSSESTMDEDTTTETEQAQEGSQEAVDDETGETSIAETSGESRTNVSTSVRNINDKVKKIIAKIKSELKKTSDNLRAVQLVTIKGMTMDGPSLSEYQNKQIQPQINPYSSNPDFFQTINILEQQQIYADARLAYRDNDLIAVHQSKLIDINNRKIQLLRELQELKRN